MLYYILDPLPKVRRPRTGRVRQVTVRTRSDFVSYNIIRKVPNLGWLYIPHVRRECGAGFSVAELRGPENNKERHFYAPHVGI